MRIVGAVETPELDGWDDLFRRYAVRISDHGTDEHGAYWIAEPFTPGTAK